MYVVKWLRVGVICWSLSNREQCVPTLLLLPCPILISSHFISLFYFYFLIFIFISISFYYSPAHPLSPRIFISLFYFYFYFYFLLLLPCPCLISSYSYLLPYFFSYPPNPLSCLYCETQPPASIGWVALSSVVFLFVVIRPAL